MMRSHAGVAPARAVKVLELCLPVDDRDEIVGDLLQSFADRVDAGRRANRLWFWCQAAMFAAASLAPQPPLPIEGGSKMSYFEGWGRSARHAGRRLRHDWRFAAGVVLILAAGLGPAAAMVSVVDTVLLKPLAYANPDRLAMVRIDLDQLLGHPGLSPAESIDLRNSGLFTSVETQTRLVEVSMELPDRMVSLQNINMTTGMLPMLGITPVAGRLFNESDFPAPPAPLAPGTPRPTTLPPPARQVALIDYDAWQTYFAGETAAIGRVVTVNNRPTEIVGGLPRGFQLATGRAVPRRVDIYTPFRLTDFRNSWQFPTLARLPEGRTFAEVQAGLDRLAAALKQKYPEVYTGALRFRIEPVLDDMVRGTEPALRAAMAAVLLLLAIAFANATALVIARLRVREHELAIQQALGAARSTLAAQVLMESAWLGVTATLVGSLFAAGTMAVIREVIPRTVPRWDQIEVGWSLIAYAGVLTFVGLLLSGLGLVWKVSRTSVLQALRDGSVQGGRAEGSASRLVLAGSQMALTVVLAFGCAQLARSASNLQHVDLGYDPNVLTIRVPYNGRAFLTPSDRAGLYQRIRDRVAQVPGVTSVGVVTHAPLSGSTMTDGYEADLSKEPSFAQAANYQGVTPGYFKTMKIPMLQGRDFTDQEDATLQPAIVVDETLVRKVFPGEANVIGRTLRLGWGLANARIVGVVGHARTIEVGRAVRPQIYSSVGNLFQNVGIVTVRASGDVMALRSQIEAAIREVGPGRAVGQAAMLSDNVTAAMSTLVAVTGLVSFLAVTAAALSAVGLYIVIAFIVHERRRSAAIRTALGATAGQVMWAYIRTGGLVMVGAVAVGVVLSLGAAALFSDLLYGVSPRDPVSLGLAVVIAALISMTAMCLPTRKAARADIVRILREA